MKFLRDLTADMGTRNWSEIPQSVVDKAKIGILDYVGDAIAGSIHAGSKQICAYALRRSSTGTCRFFGTEAQGAPEMAALYNGFAAHVFDIDDCIFSTLAHPTAPVAPAVIAAAETIQASGKDCIRAYILGLEIMNRIGRLCCPHASEQGWHTTGIFGVLGASAGASLVLGYPPEVIGMAVGIAASMASGLRSNFGTLVKPFHAGSASEKGLQAAFLAGAGIQSSPSALEGVDGFLQIYGGLQPGSSIGYVRDSNWELLEPGLMFKRFACCSGMAPALECILESPQAQNIAYEDIDHIEVGVSLLSPRELVHSRPQNATECKFSMEYAIASALVYRRADIDVFTHDALVHDQRIQRLMDRITVQIDDELAKRGFIADAPVKIEIFMRGGERISLARDYAKGNTLDPLSFDEMKNKFESLVVPVIGESRTRKLFPTVCELERLDDISKLTSLC